MRAPASPLGGLKLRAFEFVALTLKGPFLSGSHFGLWENSFSLRSVWHFVCFVSPDLCPGVTLSPCKRSLPNISRLSRWRGPALRLVHGWLCPGIGRARAPDPKSKCWVWGSCGGCLGTHVTQALCSPRLAPGSIIYAFSWSGLPWFVEVVAQQSFIYSYHISLFQHAMAPLI